MVRISRDEADYLRGIGMGNDIYISSKTHKGRAKKYYLKESEYCLSALGEHREAARVG